MDQLLEVKGLWTQFFTEEGIVQAVNDVSFSLAKGERLGIVGESGSGKSVTAMSITRLIPEPPGRIVAGEVLFHGEDLLKKSKKELRTLRGSKISMIFQEPMTALNPLLSVSYQIKESLRIHQNLRGRSAEQKAIDMLRLVGIPSPEKRIKDYPHQLSGGMRQRVMIAIALCCEPELIICDEPTTALDVTIQAQILDLLDDLNKKTGTSILMITHDLGVISQITERVIVMYAGQLVEYGDTRAVLSQPRHPYTAALLASMPAPEKAGKRLHVIPGMVPSLSKVPKGCRFHERCAHCMPACLTKTPELLSLDGDRQVRCLLYERGE